MPEVTRSQTEKPLELDLSSPINIVTRIVTLTERIEDDVKSLGKRVASDGKAWPEEIRTFLRYLRELRDDVEQQHPELIK